MNSLTNNWINFILLATVTWSILPFSTLGQTNNKAKIQTRQYAGTYSYGENIEKEPVGSVVIYPETDSTILFCLDVCRGAPSYNLGQLYSRLKIVNGTGVFSEKYEWEKKGCRWSIQFLRDKLIIKTIDEQDGCGFGYAVYADGTFNKKSSDVPAFFIDLENKKIFFEQTKPENYLK